VRALPPARDILARRLHDANVPDPLGPAGALESRVVTAEGQLAAFIAKYSPILRGRGNVARNLPLDAPEDLDRPEVEAVIDAALGLAGTPMEASAGAELLIKSVSAKQRARR
jgi:hypothetical protein